MDNAVVQLGLDEIQQRIRQTFGEKDQSRGDLASFVWLAEEFGELATALRSGSNDDLAAEMADVIAWLASLANIRDIRLAEAFERKYGSSCPRCRQSPCTCDTATKP